MTLFNGIGSKITVLGGGTGLSVLLTGLKELTTNLVAVCTVADDGGNSGQLRQDLDVIPPGDIRACVSALSEESLLKQLIDYRFKDGYLNNTSLGNLIITALNELNSFDYSKTAAQLRELLGSKGQVMPCSKFAQVLVAKTTESEYILGESNIYKARNISSLSIKSEDYAVTPTEVLEAINESDLIVLGPGSLYTSILPPLKSIEIQKALKTTKAKIVLVCNLFNDNECKNLTAADFYDVVRLESNEIPISYFIVNEPRKENIKFKKWFRSFDIKEAYCKCFGTKLLELVEGESLIQKTHNSAKLATFILTNCLIKEEA